MSSVDVVIPCYKYAHYLKTSVDSVLSQRGVDVRALIVDDQSPDNTAEVAAKLCSADSRVTYRLNPKNLGLIGTANSGIMDWASADYVVLLSADDALTPGALARAAKVMDENPEIGMVYGRCLIMTDSLPPAPADALEPTWKALSTKQFLQRNFEVGNPTPSPSVVVRTSLQHKLGGYLPQLKHTSDMEMWMRFATQGPIGVIQEPGAFYRLHASNMSNAFNNQALRDRQEIIDTCEEIANRCGASLPEAAGWLTDLKRRFADEAFWLAGRAIESGDMERLRLRLDFANRHHPSPLTSGPAWRFRVKRLLGRSLWTAISGKTSEADAVDTANVGADTESAAYREQRGAVGWWPEAA